MPLLGTIAATHREASYAAGIVRTDEEDVVQVARVASQVGDRGEGRARSPCVTITCAQNRLGESDDAQSRGVR